MLLFGRIIIAVSKYLDWVARLATFVMAIVVVADIVGRIVGTPIMGSVDIVSMLSVILVSFSIPYCGVQKGHVTVDLVVNWFPLRARRIMHCVTQLISVGLFGLLAWDCTAWGTQLLHSNRLLEVIKIPTYPFVYAVGLGSLMLALVIVVDVFSVNKRNMG